LLRKKSIAQLWAIWKQESREFGAWLIACPSGNQSRPDLLEEIRGRAGIANVAQQIAVQRTFVPGIQRDERTRIAVAVAQHQVHIFIEKLHARSIQKKLCFGACVQW
jgi:hypothetical protein